MPAINELPLMPGVESLPAQEAAPPAPTAQEQYTPNLLDDCPCADCVGDRLRQSSRDEPATAPAPPSANLPEWLYGDARMTIPDLGATEFRTVTGRSPGGSPQMANLPRPAPVSRARQYAEAYGASPINADLYGVVANIMLGDSFDLTALSQHPPTRIRGRYDFATATNSVYNGMQDLVRWREPGTLQVWDSPTGGRPQWTYIEELPDGSLVDRVGRRWRPTEV